VKENIDGRLSGRQSRCRWRLAHACHTNRQALRA
jgi:hypothetical protein